MTLRYRCSALPTELSSHLGDGLVANALITRVLTSFTALWSCPLFIDIPLSFFTASARTRISKQGGVYGTRENDA